MFRSGESFNNANTEQSGEDERRYQDRGNKVYRAAREQAHEAPAGDEQYENMSDEELLKLYRELAKKHPEEATANAGAPTPVVEEQPAEPETISSAAATETKEHASRNSAFKKFIAGALIAATVFTGGAFAGAGFAKKEAPKTNPTTVEDVYGGVKDERQEKVEVKDLTGIEALDEKIDGSFEQDDNVGCYEDSNKVHPNSVGNPDAVLKEMGVNPEDATPEQRGTASEYVTYSMKYPAAFQAIAYGIDGFEDLSLNKAEDKIANMSDEEKVNFQKQLHEFHENSEYSEEVGQGVYRNHGVTEREDGRHSYFVESDLTGKNILVRETKLNDGTIVTTKEKEDCANMLTEIEYRSPDGNTTVVKVNTPDEPTPTPIPEPTPTPPGPGHEWGKSGDPHSGPNRQPSDLVDPSSRVSKEKNDNTNKGNQGNAKVRPGSPSGAKNNERISGGTDQSGGGTAGKNNAPKGDPKADTSGNNSQKAAQEKSKVGGNNNSDSAEESRVAEGDF